MPCFNAIWQGDALSYAIRSLALVRVAAAAAERDRPARHPRARRGALLRAASSAEPRVVGEEGRLALLGDAASARASSARLRSPTDRLVRVGRRLGRSGGRSLGKPTGSRGPMADSELRRLSSAGWSSPPTRSRSRRRAGWTSAGRQP